MHSNGARCQNQAGRRKTPQRVAPRPTSFLFSHTWPTPLFNRPGGSTRARAAGAPRGGTHTGKHPAQRSSHHSFSLRTRSSSSGVKSFLMLNVLRISSGVLPLNMLATVLHV